MTRHTVRDTRGHDDWPRRAACQGEDTELWFPVGNTGTAALQIEDAKAICHWCSVRAACLDYALETRQEHGIWGGLDEWERRALKRREQRGRAS